MKELGVVIRWGRVVPGREQEAVELFGEAQKFYADRFVKGELTYFEPFMYLSGDGEIDTGFFILKGPAAKITEIIESEANLRLKTRANLLLSHVSVELLVVGEEVLSQLARFGEASKALGKVLIGTHA